MSHAEQLRRPRIEAHPAPKRQLWLEVFYTIAFLPVVGGFAFYFSGGPAQDPLVAIGAGSIASQLVLSSIYLLSGLVLVRSGALWLRAWPVFLLPILALASAAWSPDAGLTLRRSIALFGTVIFALSLTASFGVRGSMRVLVRALGLAVVLSVIWAIVVPAYGVHQSSDFVEPIHAGKWRGIFVHKNMLGGYIAGAAFSLTLVFGREAYPRLWWVRVGVLAAALACLVMAQSGTGAAIAVSVSAVGLLVTAIVSKPIELRLPLLFFMLGIGVAAIVYGDELYGMALDLLGKDRTLTGRTVYWSYMFQSMDGHWALGHGFFAGVLALNESVVQATGYGIGSTHNGYIDLLISLGAVGLAAGIGYLGWIFALAVGRFLSASTDPLNAAPLCILTFGLLHNFVESSVVAPNSIVPLLIAAAAGMLVYKDRTASTEPATETHAQAMRRAILTRQAGEALRLDSADRAG